VKEGGMNAFLSYEWAGIIIALLILLIGYGIFSFGRHRKRRGLKWGVMIFGCLILLVSTALLYGSVHHVYQIVRANQKYPPPGKLYDVGGFKMHILAEGENVETEKGRTPTIIFIAGGYTPGHWLWHVHKAIARETRSILFDRAGTGWSQRSPFPRHVKRDVEELKMLLEAAAEKGPYILVGHSWGGFFANNFAFHYPGDVAGLVLFEATPPSSTWGLGVKGMKLQSDYSRLSAVLNLFSLGRLLPSLDRKDSRDPDSPNFTLKPLREIWELVKINVIRSRARWAYAESQRAAIKHPELQVQEEGALGEIPMFAIYRENMNSDFDDLPEAERRKIKAQTMKWLKLTEQEFDELMRSGNESVRAVPRLSRRGELIYPPQGSTHYFPYEFPDYCLEKIREMIALVMRKPG
jgi:pimeloyl-ACP methyl ester carboxylesterase